MPAAWGALALAACLAMPAAAQQPAGLRGTVSDYAPAASPATPAPRAARQGRGVATARPAAVGAPAADAEEPEDASRRAGLDNERTGAVEGRPHRRDDNAYAPPGMRAGTFVLRPRLEQGIGWTSNAAAAAGGAASTYSETGLRLDAASDWSRHRAAFSVDGSYRRSLAGERIDEIEGGVSGRIDLDLAHELGAFAAAGYRLQPESASAPGTVAAAVNRPLRHTIDASAGLAKDAGPLRLGLAGALVRETFADAELSDGSVVSQRERDSTLATATLRAGYALSPALMPFVEGEIGRRIHDEKLDGSGYARSADRYALRGGVALDLGGKLSGEASLGWLTERPDDPRLDPVSGLSVAGSLSWSPVRGTIVGLAASTTVEGATAPGNSGSLLYSGTLSARRDLRAGLTGEASAGVDWRDYSGGGHDLVLRGEASLTWWMNRYAGITARARHETQQSSLPGRDWDATSLWLGMTFQR